MCIQDDVFKSLLLMLVFSHLLVNTTAECKDDPKCRLPTILYGRNYMCYEGVKSFPPQEFRDKCRKACSLCQPSQPRCSRTRYGCCWDRKTPKWFVDGRNCPECKDRYPHLCQKFKEICTLETSISYEIMHNVCPMTCGDCTSRVSSK